MEQNGWAKKKGKTVGDDNIRFDEERMLQTQCRGVHLYLVHQLRRKHKSRATPLGAYC